MKRSTFYMIGNAIMIGTLTNAAGFTFATWHFWAYAVLNALFLIGYGRAMIHEEDF